LQRKDPTYQETRLHFENLVKKYGNFIIILNFVNSFEKKLEDTILSGDFSNATKIVNRDLPKGSQLKFIA